MQVYNSQGKHDDAVESHKKALAIYIKTLGEEHPSVATTYWNMGALYKAKGDKDTARGYLEKALAIFRVAVGENHPNTKGVRNWLASL